MILSKAASLALGLLLVATACSSKDSDADGRRSRPEVINVAFDAPVYQGQPLVEIPYGGQADEVGFVPVCTAGCSPPCPCTAPIQPSAFEVDESGNAWILDNAKERVAVFDASAKLLRESGDERGLLIASDLQLVKGEAVVLTQNQQSEALLIKIDPPAAPRVSPLIFEGAPTEGYRLWTDGETIFTTVFADQGGSEREVPVQVIPEHPGFGEAMEVPGRTFPGGWFLFQFYGGQDVIPLAVSSADQNWRLTIRLKFTQTVDGETKSRRGSVSWESEISPDGTIHLLLFAGTEGKNATDGYWYLRVAPDGTVGRAVHLRGPSRRDDQQSRRLSLDPAGRPFVMWAEREGVRIESLAALQP